MISDDRKTALTDRLREVLYADERSQGIDNLLMEVVTHDDRDIMRAVAQWSGDTKAVAGTFLLSGDVTDDTKAESLAKSILNHRHSDAHAKYRGVAK